MTQAANGTKLLIVLPQLWKHKPLTWQILIIPPDQKAAGYGKKSELQRVHELLTYNFKGEGRRGKACVLTYPLIKKLQDTWVEFKKHLMKKYCPQLSSRRMEDKILPTTVKGNDLKTYVRRFQELAILCPTMVLDFEKMIEVFIRGLPRSIEGNVTASKPQTLDEAINIAHSAIGTGTTPIARVPYRLAPSEMQELSNQLQELSDRGFIRLSTSALGDTFLFVQKRKTDTSDENRLSKSE
ncbi:reverse transcriptase domain-containing protein [Tanacetum coccineum]